MQADKVEVRRGNIHIQECYLDELIMLLGFLFNLKHLNRSTIVRWEYYQNTILTLRLWLLEFI